MCLWFDDIEAVLREFHAEVSQGSPLFLILFILYIALLYEELEGEGIIVVGFADNINLIVYNSDVVANCKYLEYTWIVYERWAVTRGMAFALEKSELMHFTQVNALSK